MNTSESSLDRRASHPVPVPRPNRPARPSVPEFSSAGRTLNDEGTRSNSNSSRSLLSMTPIMPSLSSFSPQDPTTLGASLELLSSLGGSERSIRSSTSLPLPPPLQNTILGTLLDHRSLASLGAVDRSFSPTSSQSASPRKRPSDSPLVRPSQMHHLYNEDDDMDDRKPDEIEEEAKLGEEEEVPSDDDQTQTEPPSIDEFLKLECRKRGWGTGSSRPTSNPFVLYGLCMTQTNPWNTRSLHLIDPSQLSSALENSVYAKSSSVRHGLEFVPRNGDVIVSGIYRSGQTPLLQIVASLKQRTFVSKVSLLTTADWLEAAHPPRDPAFHRHDQGGRLIKTHLPLRTVFGGVIAPSCGKDERPPFHVIVVLRDPIDVRLSWFRHVRRVYRKFHGSTSSFDAHVHVDDFSSVHLYATNPNISAVMVNSWDYEHYVNEAVKSGLEDRNPHILLVHYEELLLNPRGFVQRVADFLGNDLYGRDTELLDTIAEGIMADEDFPAPFLNKSATTGDHKLEQPQELDNSHRRGCSGQGRLVFSTDSLRRFDNKWRDLVTAHAIKPMKGGFIDYEKLMEFNSPLLRDILVQLSSLSVTSSFSSTAAMTGKAKVHSSSTAVHIASIITPRGFTRLGSLFKSSSASGSAAKSRSNTEDSGTMSEELHFAEDQSEQSEVDEGSHGEGGSEYHPPVSKRKPHPEPAFVEQQQQHVMALFPSHYHASGPTSSSTPNNNEPFTTTRTTRTRTSSVLSFGQAFKESLAPSHHRPQQQRSVHSPIHVMYSVQNPRHVDPDDTSDEELNMFLDLNQSKFYKTRRATGAVKKTSS